MFETLLNKYGINQIGIVVDDLEKAALQHSKLYGSGPFFYLPPMEMNDLEYHGQKAPVTMQCAYGAYGSLQIELIKVLSEGPSVYEDQKGFNHFSIWSDDKDAVIEEFRAEGFEPAMIMHSGGGLDVVYIDCREPWGHFVEVHKPQPFLVDMCLNAAKDWDGQNPYRKMGA